MKNVFKYGHNFGHTLYVFFEDTFYKLIGSYLLVKQ
tara:strand:+ start:38 stop:145 length:108 start_codon:yes stop_codon:yes gene_type:complete